MSATRGIGPEKMTFMAESKPGHPDAYAQRMLQNAQLQNEKLRKEIVDMRREIFDLEKSNEQLTAETAKTVQRLDVMTEELARAVVRIVDLKLQKSDLMGVCNDLRKRLEESDSVLLRREIFNLRKEIVEWKLKEVKLAREVFDLQGSNDTLRRMMKEKK